MPVGYREYVTRLGYGELASIQVLTPDMVRGRLGEHRGLMAGYWMWASPDVVFGQDEAVESVCIADTWHGDVMVVAPALPDRIVVLPRSADSIVVLDGMSLRWWSGCAAVASDTAGRSGASSARRSAASTETFRSRAQ